MKYLRGILVATVIVLVLRLVAGCRLKPSALTSAAPASATRYFQTPFQNESQFIVQAIVSDLAEEMYYAAHHRLPKEKSVSVAATEKPGTSPDAPVYELLINLRSKRVKCDVTINGPIWSPQIYEGVGTQLARAVALKPSRSAPAETTTLLDQLTDGTPGTIERENQRISEALENDFANPELHEEAALLLGAFLLRDHSGEFFEIRSPLSRLTAHLALAHFLRGPAPAGVNGQVAGAMALTLMGDEALAVEQLNRLGTNDAAVLPFVRALRARNTGDFRALGKLDGPTPVEAVEWFSARCTSVRTSFTWPMLSDERKRTIDFVRTANAKTYSVEIGHELLQFSIPLELKEISSVYELSHSGKLTRTNLVAALNEPPEGCFTRSGGKTQVRVIGWGQWANFLQRHLCQAVRQNFYFMNHLWGVPDDAREFASKCDEAFGGLRLYPFVRVFNSADDQSKHKAEEDALKVITAAPQLVPAGCWDYVFSFPSHPRGNMTIFNTHMSAWYSHNPTPGTVYDFRPRSDHLNLFDAWDRAAGFERLHEMAPYDYRIGEYLVLYQYHEKPTYEQAASLFQAELPYSIMAMRVVAKTVEDQPERYEKMMLQAAALDPACYYILGDFELKRDEEDLAAKYIDQGCDTDADSVRASNRAYWRVQYYLKKGQIEKARQIADEGSEVYSSIGLEAKASFLEKTTNYVGAFEWFSKIKERYDDSAPLIAFCERYKKLTGDTRFDSVMKELGNEVFTNGMDKVVIADLHGPPTDGVAIKQQNDLLMAAGLHAGDVIVALNGTRTHTFNQYMYVRGMLKGPELDLIVWQNHRYREIEASPPNHLFGADFGDYRAE